MFDSWREMADDFLNIFKRWILEICVSTVGGEAGACLKISSQFQPKANQEALPVAHQAALSTLVAGHGIWLVTSVPWTWFREVMLPGVIFFSSKKGSFIKWKNWWF